MTTFDYMFILYKNYIGLFRKKHISTLNIMGKLQSNTDTPFVLSF